jgi:hypothetical protein
MGGMRARRRRPFYPGLIEFGAFSFSSDKTLICRQKIILTLMIANAYCSWRSQVIDLKGSDQMLPDAKSTYTELYRTNFETLLQEAERNEEHL